MPKTNTSFIAGKPELLIFREVLPGDVKKQQAKSNIAQSGGGARDLRFRNAKSWLPFFGRMFTTPTSQSGVFDGVVHWVGTDGAVKSATASYWRPTKARPNELRIGRIHSIEGWKIDEKDFYIAKSNGERWFFALFLDDQNRLWAKLIQQKHLALETKAVRDYILKRIKETKSNGTVCGAINLRDLHQTLEAHISTEQAHLLNQVTSPKKLSPRALEAVDEVTRGRNLEEVIAEWVKKTKDVKPKETERRIKLLRRCYGLVRSLKEKHGYKCQIDTCRFTFKMRNGRYYCEAAHIKPLSGREAGSDSPENILILCPNHHKMLDYGAMKVISSAEVEIADIKLKIIAS